MKKEKCAYPGCDKEVWKNDANCIFHSKDINSKSQYFEGAFVQWLLDQNQSGGKKIDCGGFEFPRIDFSFLQDIQIKKPIIFDGASFHGEVNFEYLNFGADVRFRGTRFLGESSFLQATFNGEVYFIEAEFMKKAKFNNVTFNYKASFFRTIFSDVVYFDDTTFNGHAVFRLAEFHKYTSFEKAKFSNPTTFQGVTFFGDTFFSEAQFDDAVTFDHGQFKGDIHFYLTKFLGLSGTSANFSLSDVYSFLDFGNAEFGSERKENGKNVEIAFDGMRADGRVSFNDTKFYCSKATFREAQFKDRLEFKVEPRFLDRIWMVETFIFDLIGDSSRLGGQREPINESRGLIEGCLKRRKKHNLIPKRFRLLNPPQFTPIFGEKVAARYPLAARDLKDDRFIMRFSERHRILSFFWCLFADYGRSFFRWALWSIFFAMVFALIYFNCFYLPNPRIFAGGNILSDWPAISFLYYSFVTFTTLGFGDIVPHTGWLQFWVTLEVVIGYIMLGGLVGIMASKLARRS